MEHTETVRWTTVTTMMPPGSRAQARCLGGAPQDHRQLHRVERTPAGASRAPTGRLEPAPRGLGTEILTVTTSARRLCEDLRPRRR